MKCVSGREVKDLQEYLKISDNYAFTCKYNAELHMAFGPYNDAFCEYAIQVYTLCIFGIRKECSMKVFIG